MAPPPPPPTPKVTLIKGVKVEEQEPASERHQKTSQPQGATPAGRERLRRECRSPRAAQGSRFHLGLGARSGRRT